MIVALKPFDVENRGQNAPHCGTSAPDLRFLQQGQPYGSYPESQSVENLAAIARNMLHVSFK